MNVFWAVPSCVYYKSAPLPPFIIFFRVRLGLEGLCGEGVSVLFPRISGNISTGIPLGCLQLKLRNIPIELPLVRPHYWCLPPPPALEKLPKEGPNIFVLVCSFFAFYLARFLKGTVSRDFLTLGFFHGSSFFGPLIIATSYLPIFIHIFLQIKLRHCWQWHQW